MAIMYYGHNAPPVSLTTSKHITQLVPHLIGMTVSRTMDQVSELVVTVDDPDWDLLGMIGEPLGGSIKTMGLSYLVDSYDLDPGGGQGGLVLNCRPAAVRALKDRRGPLVMNKVSPTTFVHREVLAVGGKFVGQPSAVRSRVAREVTSNTNDEKPSSWTTIRTLAEDLGYMFYEDGGTFYFGKPSWLVKNVGRIKIDRKHSDVSLRPLSLPTMSASLDEPNGTEYSFTMGVEHAVDMRPGIAVELVNFPARNGVYLLTAVDHPIYGSSSNVTLTLRKPIDPEVVKV